MSGKNKEKKSGHRQGQRDRDDSRSSGSPSASGTRFSSYGGSGTSLSYETLANYVYGSLPLIKEAAETKPEGLPRREGDLPIMAWKHAQIVRTTTGYRFRGLTASGTEYDAVSTAECSGSSWGGYAFTFYSLFGTPSTATSTGTASVTPSHAAPDEGCRCGFYGLTERPEKVDRTSHFQLEVEFYGTVIVAEKGYRAEKQRVLAVHLPERCEFCEQEPTQFVLPNGYGKEHDESIVARCETHVGPFDVPLAFATVQADLGVVFA